MFRLGARFPHRFQRPISPSFSVLPEIGREKRKVGSVEPVDTRREAIADWGTKLDLVVEFLCHPAPFFAPFSASLLPSDS